MGSKVKELVDATAATMDELARKTNLSSAFGEHTPGQLITMELMMFAMYMSASDGEIQKEEAEHIAEVFGLPFTPAMIGETIRKFDIYSKTFETKVPVSMQIFVAIDNALHEKGLNGRLEQPASETLFEVFKVVAATVVSADGIVTDREKRDAEIYLTMLKNYMDENLTVRKDMAKGFKKTGEDISEERMMDIVDKMNE